MSKTLSFLLACALAPIAWPAWVGAQDLAFAHNFLSGSRQLVSFPVGTPTSMSLVGPQGDVFTGMDFDPAASVLWAVSFTGQSLGTMNQASGAYTPVVALQGGCCTTAFTIDPVGGKFYVSRGDALIYELNPTTGAAVPVAQGAPSDSQITALAYDCTGRLFAVDGRPDFRNVYRVNFSGSPVLVGDPGLVSATSLEFDNATGNLYAWFNAAGTDTSTHARMDPSTAQPSASSVVAGRYRMAIRNMCSAEQLRLFGDGFEG